MQDCYCYTYDMEKSIKNNGNNSCNVGKYNGIKQEY